MSNLSTHYTCTPPTPGPRAAAASRVGDDSRPRLTRRGATAPRRLRPRLAGGEVRQGVQGGRATPAGVREKAPDGAAAQRRVGASAVSRHAMASLLLNGAGCHGNCVKQARRHCRHHRRRHRCSRRRCRRCRCPAVDDCRGCGDGSTIIGPLAMTSSTSPWRSVISSCGRRVSYAALLQRAGSVRRRNRLTPGLWLTVGRLLTYLAYSAIGVRRSKILCGSLLKDICVCR